ncbi:MAG: DUF839 domain-containing protein, partial [Alphaproteobacteria bacterium]|nr:DUF839 domain-containing protein [Alphaproteobacteria bacterium]
MTKAHTEDYATRAEAFEASENEPARQVEADTFGDIVEVRYSRRGMLRGLTAVAAITAISTPLESLVSRAAAAAAAPFKFDEISHGVDETHHVAPGYSADVLIRWGDRVLQGAPGFEPAAQTASAQAMQFGYNNDYIGYAPLPFGSNSSERALLCVNHEYTSEEVMFPGIGRQDKDGFPDMTAELVAIEMAAHGGSVVQVEKAGGKWRVADDLSLNRRITAETPMRLSGPAAGHDRLKTSADSTGTRVLGTVNNCAGGMTPWGTYLMAEENFHGYFWGELAEDHPEAQNYKRY